MSSDDVIPLPTSALSEIMHSGKKSCERRKLINVWKEITFYELMIKIILYTPKPANTRCSLLTPICTLESCNVLRAAYHWFPEELVLGVVFAENEPGVTFEGPGCLNFQHHLVVL